MGRARVIGANDGRLRAGERDRGPRIGIAAAIIAGLALAGCVSAPSSTGVPTDYGYPDRGDVFPGAGPAGRLTDGINLLGGGDDESGARIGINALLWRASLDTVSFMPLASADPFGGVIITDWYTDPATPNERFKVSVYILDKRLRADAVRVSLFRQTRSGGNWVDAAVSDGAGRQLEDQILTRARQLRIAGVEG